MSEQENSNDAFPRRRRIHKRTLAIVFCFVVLPWILVAVPGDHVESWGTTGSNGSAFAHGWPFIHLDRTEVGVNGSWVNGKYTPGPVPAGLDLDKKARESAREHPPLRLDLRLDRQEVASFNYDPLPVQPPYWTESMHWPRIGKGRYLTIRPLGLIANLLILGLAILLSGWLVERRVVRRGKSLLRFSLKTLLVVTALVALAIGWFVRERSSHADAHEKALKLAEVDVDVLLKFKERFPRVISQLFNNGHLPLMDPLFFSVLDKNKSGVAELRMLDDMDAVQISSLADLTIDLPFQIQLEILYYTRDIENQLSKLDQVESLIIAFDFEVWVNSFSDDENYTGDIINDLKISGKRVNLQAKFSGLKRLDAILDPELDQESQLKAFCGLETLEQVELYELSQVGVDFLVKTKEQWPDDIYLDFDEEVTEESRRLLIDHFNLIYDENNGTASPTESEDIF